MKDETVLVTGATGYIAMHCILRLLQAGYRVRGTLRSPAREAGLRQAFARHIAADDRIAFVTADLLQEAGWAEAAEGCAYVLHTASPLPRQIPRDESEVIKPAVEGTRRVLQAAKQAGVRRVVITSSVAAMRHDDARQKDRPVDETNWSNTAADIPVYDKSKTLAERAAWDFVAENEAFELVTINPSVVIGPLLNDHYSLSVETILRLMRSQYPGCPRLGWVFVDVRDVADAHLAALTTPEAAGMRFSCAHKFAWMRDLARILDAEFSSQGYKIPTRPLPDFLMRFLAIFDKTAAMYVPNLGRTIAYSNAQIKRVLGWQPRPLAESVIDTGKSLIEFDVV